MLSQKIAFTRVSLRLPDMTKWFSAYTLSFPRSIESPDFTRYPVNGLLDMGHEAWNHDMALVFLCFLMT